MRDVGADRSAQIHFYPLFDFRDGSQKPPVAGLLCRDKVALPDRQSIKQIATHAHATRPIDSKRLEKALTLFRKKLLELQDTAVIPEPMDIQKVIQQAKAWEVSNSKEGNP